VTGMRASYVKVLVAEAVTLAALYWFQFAFL
jgi:hypothetical protein